MAKPASISLILKTANEIEPYSRKIEYVRAVAEQIQQKALLYSIVQIALHPGVVSLLPKGNLVYHPVSKDADADYRLFREQKKLYMFFKGGLDNLNQNRREAIFIQVLESIHPDDAALLIQVKDKVLPYPNLTYDFWREAFPGEPDQGGILPEKPKGPWELVKNAVAVVPQITQQVQPQVEPVVEREVFSVDVGNMTKAQAEAYIKEKFGSKIEVATNPTKVYKPNPNKGKGRWNDGVKNLFATDEEAAAKGLIYGWLQK